MRSFRDITATFKPPAEGAEPQVSALDGLQRLVRDMSLTAPAIRTTIAESGASLDNTAEAVRNTTYEVTSIKYDVKNDEPVGEDFSSSGTLAELIQMVRHHF